MPKTKRKTAPKITPPTRQQVLAVSIGVAGIAGWLVDSKLVALLAAYINGDEESGQIALDRAHELGLHEGGALPVEVKWPKIKPHEHTWLPWARGDDERAMRTAAAAYGAISALPCTIRRCTCGLFEHEQCFMCGAPAEVMLRFQGEDRREPVCFHHWRTEEYRYSWAERLPGRDTPAFLPESGEAGPCEDRRCDLPRGHVGAHYARWYAGHGNTDENWWDDDVAADDIAPYLGH